jgi:hypothetical protein
MGLFPSQSTPTPALSCAAHLRRTGSHVPARRVVDGEAFCLACFRGDPISPAPELPRRSKSQQSDPPDLHYLLTDRPVVELADLDAGETELPDSNDGIPDSHQLTDLEIKLLSALQEILLHEPPCYRRFIDDRISGMGRENGTKRLKLRGLAPRG